ncbi:hypothetical protein BVRB_020080 [Beta vulgaris subsp. vulgaris]|uniref:Uncharacterized protein n=1 Tax=Beta vulgaris subsp. vulgaris TaxID=3555 RepID=A0A0J8B0Q7_BETVV|nr:hypothetical protein BVRB_020080 [Beta vulgaris subsp. vulgaris]
MVRLSQQTPLFADLSGGMKSIANLKTLSMEIRSSFMESAAVRNAPKPNFVQGSGFVAVDPASHQSRVLSSRSARRFEIDLRKCWTSIGSSS